MISGIVSNSLSMPGFSDKFSSFLILAYEAPDTYGDEMTEDRARQARKTAERPEIRIISHAGEELSADALGVTNYQAWSCNDYIMAEVDGSNLPGKSGKCYVVLSPKDIVIVRPRDRKDHILWLVDRQRYDEALEEVEKLDEDERSADGDHSDIDPIAIGERYIRHLVGEGKVHRYPSCRFSAYIVVRQLYQGCKALSKSLRRRHRTLGKLDIYICPKSATAGMLTR
jgi:hypothetical protein